MAITLAAKATLERFYHAIAPWENAYDKNSFTYLAIREDDKFVIQQSGLWLHSLESKIPFTHFRSTSLRAGHYRLSELGIDHRQLADAILSGKISLCGEVFYFPPSSGGFHSLSFTPVHPSSQQSQNRVNVVKIGGSSQTVNMHRPLVDWEARGAATPFDNIEEILTEYGLGALFGDSITLEIIATAVMAIDARSIVSGEAASIKVRLARLLDTNVSSVGYRVFSQGKVHSRNVINANDFAWIEKDDILEGEREIKVPAAAVIHCYANYKGVTQSHWWVNDPTKVQNARRTVYETFDSELVALKEYISRQGRGRNARDLESGAAWLFWMLGFSVAHLGKNEKTQDAADLLVVSPAGNFAVVECTTGLLKTDQKLPNLIARADAVRKNLDSSNNNHLRVLPIILTSKTRDEIRADLDQAERLGVFVMTRETLEQAITRSLIAPSADDLFSQAEKQVREALEKFLPPLSVGLENSEPI